MTLPNFAGEYQLRFPVWIDRGIRAFWDTYTDDAILNSAVFLYEQNATNDSARFCAIAWSKWKTIMAYIFLYRDGHVFDAFFEKYPAEKAMLAPLYR
jgi:hypothetical protein